jgi:hypothetical protein
MKIENQKIVTQCWAGIPARGPTLLTWPSGLVEPCQLALRACARHGHRAGTPRGTDDGCAGPGGAAGFSPETYGDGGAEKMVRHDGVPRQWQSSSGLRRRRRSPAARGCRGR